MGRAARFLAILLFASALVACSRSVSPNRSPSSNEDAARAASARQQQREYEESLKVDSKGGIEQLPTPAP